MASFTKAEGVIQAYETLRELVRKVECGEIEILDMSISQDEPETRDFNSFGEMGTQRMLVRNGDLRVELRLALRAEPRDSRGRFTSRDEAGRSRDELLQVAGPARKDYSAMTRDELLQVAGMSRADAKRVMEEIEAEELGAAKYGDPTFSRPRTDTQAPVNPLDYGARKVDID